jgi:hypothetical protein
MLAIRNKNYKVIFGTVFTGHVKTQEHQWIESKVFYCLTALENTIAYDPETDSMLNEIAAHNLDI